LEDVARSELEEISKVVVESVEAGKVFFKAGIEAMYSLNFSARTVNKLYLLLAREEFESLEDIYRIAKSIDYTEIINPWNTFAVRSERLGNHNFTSIDVRRVVGQAVIESYLSSRSTRLKVNLTNPDIEIVVFIRFNEVLIGVNTTGESLHRRWYRVYNHPAALKTTIAAAMLRIGRYGGQPLLDPLCGGATIPIEAAHSARKYPLLIFRYGYTYRKLPLHDPATEREEALKLLERVDPSVYEICCMEISPKHLKGAVENAKSARVLNTISFLNRDSTRVESHRELNVELIVTNPPYGMRSHNLKKIGLFYESLLKTLREVYSGVRLVAITASMSQFEEACEKLGIKLEHSRRVMHGGLPAKIYSLVL